MKNYVDLIKRKEDEIQSLLDELKIAKENTTDFLDNCIEASIELVSIGTKTKKIPKTETFPFGCRGSVFSLEVRDKHGWPAIWGVVDKTGIGGGCGNSMQKQVDKTPLIEGVYEFKKGNWSKIG